MRNPNLFTTDSHVIQFEGNKLCISTLQKIDLTEETVTSYAKTDIIAKIKEVVIPRPEGDIIPMQKMQVIPVIGNTEDTPERKLLFLLFDLHDADDNFIKTSLVACDFDKLTNDSDADENVFITSW